ncbi:D-alanyl-D-alanine carboxypeptidase family protein [Streptomyces vinaceus]|uniref:D-alanyl-D-alanine carboxypeptidase family protein n=1 Tax=Streptomyces vinaceus TaxID=1960 RepID=UPI0035E301CF
MNRSADPSPIQDPSTELTRLAARLQWPEQGQASVFLEGAGEVGTCGEQTPVPTASLAKVMAAYVVLTAHPLVNSEDQGPQIQVDSTAQEESVSLVESTVPLVEGQELSERKLLELMLIPSGSNAARLLARWHAGDEASFVHRMNEAAVALGMVRTTYADVCGIDPATRSTSDDQILLARAVMAIPAFRETVARYSTGLRGIGLLCNTNRLLVRPGVVGLKTGTTTPAGGNLLWALRVGRRGHGRLVLGAVMNQQPHTNLSTSREAVRSTSAALITSLRRELCPPPANPVARAWHAIRERSLHAKGWFGYHSPYYRSRIVARARA